MRDNEGCFAKLLVFAITLAVCLLFTRWKYNAVMGADFPEWLKYYLLWR